MKKFLNKPEILYPVLVLALIFSKLLLHDTWLSDQLIVYNFLSILIISVVLNFIFSDRPLLFKFLPMLILLYIFFNPGLLRLLFFISHIVILSLLVWVFLHQRTENKYRGIGISAVPLELMLLFFFI